MTRTMEAMVKKKQSRNNRLSPISRQEGDKSLVVRGLLRANAQNVCGILGFENICYIYRDICRHLTCHTMSRDMVLLSSLVSIIM